MLTNIIKKNREVFFPECKDFSSDMNHIRFEDDPKKLSYNAFFWGSPYNYKIMRYGTPGSTMLMFLVIAFVTRNWSGILAIIMLVLAAVMLYDLVRKLKDWNMYKETTMYDMYMRDYVVEKNE